jgi:hypothetical protein
MNSKMPRKKSIENHNKQIMLIPHKVGHPFHNNHTRTQNCENLHWDLESYINM